MPEYLSPGVYVEEVDAGPKPIEGVSTSTTGAVGITMRGPTSGKPVLVTSFADFTRQFGGFVAEPDDASLVNKWALDAGEGGRWGYFPLSARVWTARSPTTPPRPMTPSHSKPSSACRPARKSKSSRAGALSRTPPIRRAM